jgi:hypothetical protein
MKELSLLELKTLREALETYPKSKINAPNLVESVDTELALRGWKFLGFIPSCALIKPDNFKRIRKKIVEKK